MKTRAILLYLLLAVLLGIYTGHVFTDGALDNTPEMTPENTPMKTPTPVQIQEQDCWDDFSCHMTSERWKQVDQELGDALAEGSAPDATTRDWESCFVWTGLTSYILCPDGYTESS
jgi:hypothetical protein